MLKETKNVDFIVGEKLDENINYKILSIIPSKVQELSIVDNEIESNYVDSYRIRYKLRVGGMESPISEIKNINKFKPEIIEEIMTKAGINSVVAEVTYV